MPLKLVLKPHERIAVNGAVLRNGDRRAALLVENPARLLREGDIMQAEEANTPAKRIYFPLMMMYLDPSCRKKMHADFAERLSDFLGAVTDAAAQQRCLAIAAHVANENYYKALGECRQLMAFEKTRLNAIA